VLRKRFISLLNMVVIFSLLSTPAIAASEDYFAGGGGDDGLVTEILWDEVDDETLDIDDAKFGGADGKADPSDTVNRKGDAFDAFGFVYVRIEGNWYRIRVSEGGITSGPRDENSSTYEVTITRTVNSVLVTATLTIVDNRAKWSVSTNAPVERIAITGGLGSDGGEYWYQQSENVWWSNDLNRTPPNQDPLLRFETSSGGTIRINQLMPNDGQAGTGFEGTRSRVIDNSNTSDNVVAISAANTLEFNLSVCIFDYTSENFGSGTANAAARNTYIDSLNTQNCSLTPAVGFSWVGDQSISCPAPNPWVNEKLGFASNVQPVLVSAENTIGKTITQDSYDSLKSSGVVFDTVSTKVSTATETLPIYGCKDKLLSGKLNQPIQFIAGGYTLQSDAHGYINTSDLKWHDKNSVTLYTNTAAFMHTIKFTKTGKYVVVLTEQPDTSRRLIPTYGVRSIRFVININ